MFLVPNFKIYSIMIRWSRKNALFKTYFGFLFLDIYKCPDKCPKLKTQNTFQPFFVTEKNRGYIPYIFLTIDGLKNNILKNALFFGGFIYNHCF